MNSYSKSSKEYFSFDFIGFLEIQSDELYKVSGYTYVKDFIQIIRFLDLDINPRESRRNSITKAIIESLRSDNSDSLFPFKSRGLLISSNSSKIHYEEKKIEISYGNSEFEGIIDGGHTTFAIGLYILEKKGFPNSEIAKITSWKDLKSFWLQNFDLIFPSMLTEYDLKQKVPIEVLTPYGNHNSFNGLVLEISAARNTNTQLKMEAFANQEGLLDYIKNALPSEIQNRIQWKTNSGGYIDVKYLISLAWIVLNKASLPPSIIKLNGATAYSSKGESLKRYMELSRLIKEPEYNSSNNQELIVRSFDSALTLLPDLLEAHDYLVNNFAVAFNNYIGQIETLSSVRPGDNAKILFLGAEESNPKLNYFIPNGFISPVMFSLGNLIEQSHSGLLKWIVNPVDFLANPHVFQRIIESISSIIDLSNKDPQRVGKSSISYKMMDSVVQSILREKI